MIKLLVFDLDGTLLTSKKKISARTIELLKKCQQAGIQICLCSGRDYNGIVDFSKTLEMKQGYISSMNGAIVYNCLTQEKIQCRPFTVEEMERILSVSKQFHAHVLFAEGGISYWYVPLVERTFQRIYSLIHQQSTLNNFKSFNKKVLMIHGHVDEIEHPFRKAIFCNKPKKLKKISAFFEQDETLSAFFSAGDVIDIVPKGVSKGESLKTIMNLMHLSKDEVMCFGDSPNDISMFEVITHCIAMGNAVDELKMMAKEITDSNDNEGIVKMIQQYAEKGLLPKEIL